MALTLLEAAKQADEMTSVYIEEYAQSSDILATIPFMDVPGGVLAYNREWTLPGVGFRGINEGFSRSTGVMNPQSEVCKLAGGELVVDKYLVDTRGPSVRSSQELMQLKSHALAWTRNFIKGDSRTDPRVFDGLQVRLGGSQLVSNAAAGAPLSLDKLDELIESVHNPTHLIMSKKMRRRLTQAAHNIDVSGYLQTSRDQMGRLQTTYADLPILVTDFDNNDQLILPFTEVSPDGSSSTACTSIYCVSFGEDMCVGIQGASSGVYGISVRDMGEMETQPAYLTRVDWHCAIAVMHGRAAARLAGITDAAVTL